MEEIRERKIALGWGREAEPIVGGQLGVEV